jgi:hypothetical protein
MEGGNTAGRLDGGTRTADDLEALTLKEFLKSAPDEFVVIQDEDTDDSRSPVGCSETCV